MKTLLKFIPLGVQDWKSFHRGVSWDRVPRI